MEIQQREAEASRNALLATTGGILALLAVILAVYFFRQQRIIQKKNRVLIEQMTEAAAYKRMMEEGRRDSGASDDVQTAENPDEIVDFNTMSTTNTAKIPSGNKIQAGFGKIDCLAGLKQILGTTDIETVGLDGRREATPATMYSIDAPVYNMMGQQVDKSQKGLVIYKGRKYLNK